MPDLVGVFRQLNPFELGFAGVVKKTELDLGGMCRKQVRS
jgi:hypothetical protein